jgi:alkylation response protein AidB-like acyl-CoA dehydrogenase
MQIGLDFERSMMGSYLGRAQRTMDDLMSALERPDDSSLAAIAAMNVRIEAARACADDVIERIADRRSYNVEAATTKLLVTEVFKDLSYLALDLVGPPALIEGFDPDLPAQGRLPQWFRGAQVATIYGGSNEIQRNILAQHRLHLPQT